MGVTAQQRALETIGKYAVLAKVADGTMGTVYKARDEQTGVVVAIKVAAPELVRDAVMLKRFEQEFRAVTDLNHPNIVRGLDFGWQGPKPYLVMEFVDGQDLWERIARVGRLPQAEAVGYIVQVARGLQQAHKHGIIHRDIKPDNILLTTDGQAKLADLGLSKDLEAETELTRPNKGLGTPNFIAPEQFSDAKNADVRCDVYGLGATLYMALTGQMPFQARGLAGILKKKLADDLPAPRDLVPDLTEPVDWAVRRAVLADPERRFASCAEFVAALIGDKVGPTPAPNWERGGAAGLAKKSVKRPDKERRAAVRYECALQTSCAINPSLFVDDAEWQTLDGAQVRNLSVTGIGLVLARRFEPGTVLSVDLSSSDGQVKRTVEMRVVRVSRTGGSSWYLAGTLAKRLTKEELRRLL
jgi:serine/threonine protein kinase